MSSTTQQQKDIIKAKIRKEIPYVDVRPYSHNIIGLQMADLDDDEMCEVATQTDLHRLGWEHICDKNKYSLSEFDVAENKFAWLCRRTAIRINGGCGEKAQHDHDKCYMCDKEIADTKVECYNCNLTYCEDCFGDGVEGCEECDGIMYDEDDEEQDEESDEETE